MDKETAGDLGRKLRRVTFPRRGVLVRHYMRVLNLIKKLTFFLKNNRSIIIVQTVVIFILE